MKRLLLYRIIQIIPAALFIFVISVVYLYKRILKIEVKCFHLMMFTLLEILFFTYIVTAAIYPSLLSEPPATFDERRKKRIAVIFFSIAWLLDSIIHSIFAVKYWVLSRKIREIKTNT